MKFQSVLTMAPLRISFIGGGTDVNYFYKNSPGKVISAAINKYVYVHIKNHDPLFQERYRISYSEVEHTQSRAEIKNLIIKSCLELLNMDEPLQISTSSDLPASSGLGSSSSFTVALLLALHQIEGRSVSPVQIAEEAAHVEISMLNSPIGKQDQYAAAFGGLNNYHSKELNLINLTKLVDKFKLILSYMDENLIELGEIITDGWELKEKLSNLISTAQVKEIINEVKLQNCLGYKLLGAGGGGFVYALFDDLSEKYINKFPNRRSFIPRLDNGGARVVSSN